MEEANRITIIEAPEGAKFMNEFMDVLPAGIFNKKKTGCGATSVALENQENTIICCPTIQLIKSKTSQYPNDRCRFELLGIYENVSVDEINSYIKECAEKHHPVKIMVTYNSFDKVKYTIGHTISNYKIIVDEYQELLDAYIYRDKAILDLLKQLKSLSNVTYISATPIPYNFRPEELQNLSEYEIVWSNNQTIVPLQFETDSPYSCVKNLISRYKLGYPIKIGENEVREYYFFINSVRGIKEILEETGLTNRDVKVICANNSQNRKYLGSIPISNISDSNKPFTFCTKTVFCGADFYSDYGLAIIISDGYNKNTMLDIETDIYQIAGRIRNENNPFKNIILHIYNTDLGCQNEIEFTTWLNEKIQSAQGIIGAYNTVTEDTQKKAIVERVKIEDKEELALYDETANEIKLNTLKINHFQYKFKAIDIVYRNGTSIEEAYLRAGYDLTTAQRIKETITNYFHILNETSRFEGLYKEYLNLKTKAEYFEAGNMDEAETVRIRKIEEINPLVPLASQYLTQQKVKSLRYNSTDVKNAVHFELPETQTALKKAIRKSFIVGETYTNEIAKRLFQNIFDRLEIKRTAKAVDLTKYLNVEGKKIPVNNGNRKDGFIVMSYH